MAAELEINPGLLGLLQLVGLVIQHKGETLEAFGKVLQGGAGGRGTVVAADDIHALEMRYGILQEPDSGFLEELFGLLYMAIVFMVPKNGPDGRLQAAELLGIIPFHNGPEAHVDDIPANEDQVWFLLVNQVYPAGQFRPAVVVAQVQVAS